MTEEIQAYTDADLATKIVLLKTLADVVLDEFKRAKALAAEQYPKGASIPARTDSSDGDIKLGRVSRSDPKPVATVTDEEAFDAYVRDVHADKLDHNVLLGDLGEVLAVLQDLGRTDLFTPVDLVPDWVRGHVLAAAIKGALVPGVTVARPAGVVSASKERAAVELVRRLLSGAPVRLLGIEA